MEIVTTEMHTGGEPVRIIESGFPKLTASTLLGKRREVLEKYDHIRSYLMAEPRGHAAMYGAILCDGELEDADMAVLFTHNDGLSTMCGHGVIALARYAVDKGIVKRSSNPTDVTKVNIHCPCGLVVARLHPDNSVAFTSVPSFVVATDVMLKLHNGKSVKVDVAFGGAFYVVLDCTQLNIDICSEPINNLIELGDELKKLAADAVKLSHPDSDDLVFVYGAILTDGVEGVQESKHLIIFADRQVDRSACGSGTTARIAIEHYKKKLDIFQSKTTHCSKVAHSTMGGRVVEESEIALPGEDKPRPCVRVEVSGRAYYTGTSQFIVEPDDLISTAGGFLVL